MPVRDNSSVFLALGIAGVIFAVLAFVLRMAASLGKGGRQVSWDDATMAVVVVLAIPPAVFAPVRKYPRVEKPVEPSPDQVMQSSTTGWGETCGR